MSRYLSCVRAKPDELSHHGIKGQKKGIRRFQYPDGTLTPAGKKRYGSWDYNKMTSRQLARKYNDATTGEIKAEAAYRRYAKMRDNYTPGSKKYEKYDAKARDAASQREDNYAERLKFTNDLEQKNRLTNRLSTVTVNDPERGLIVKPYSKLVGHNQRTLQKTNPDGSLTDHGKKSLQRQEIKADKIKEKVDKYEQQKVKAMGKSYEALTKIGANYQRTKAFDAQTSEINYRARGIKVVNKMTSKFGDSYVEPKYQAMGQEYMSKLSDIYNERINLARK